MQATKSKPRCAADCRDHLFQLKNNNGNNKHNATVAFCPKFRRDPHPPEKTIPEYNLDSKFFTNAFILGTEKKAIAQNWQQEYMSFQTQIKDACEKNNQLFFPKPNQNNSYCSVCKEHYPNYYEHIRSDDHKTNIDAALYNNEIKRLCDSYKSLWNGAHQKADQIVNQIYMQRKLHQKGIDDENDEEDEEMVSNEGNESQVDVQDEEEQEMQNQDEKDSHDQLQLIKNGASSELKINSKKKKMDTNTEHPKINSQIGESEHVSKSKINSSFFQKGSDLIVYLKKNKNGKYEIIKNVNSIIKDQFVKEEKQQQQLNCRQEERKKKKEIQKISKQPRQIYKIKQPNHEKQQSSEYRANSSSEEYDENKGLCQTLKDKLIANRIRTRKQCQQNDKQDDHEEGRKKKNDVVPKEKERNQQVSKQKVIRTGKNEEEHIVRQQHVYNNIGRANPQIIQGYHNNQINYNRNQPPHHFQQNGFPIHHLNQHIIPKQPNRIRGQQSYMQHPPMIMNPQYFNPNMMGYGMPIRNDQVLKNDDKSKRSQQSPSMYYPHPWGPHYIIQPPPAMVHPNTANDRVRQQVPQGTHNIPPPRPYQMMQNSNNVPTNNPMMGHKMNMCLPYEMDPRYYMGYPPPYMPKKGEDPRHPQ